jgi:hypothetical protein
LSIKPGETFTEFKATETENTSRYIFVTFGPILLANTVGPDLTDQETIAFAGVTRRLANIIKRKQRNELRSKLGS